MPFSRFWDITLPMHNKMVVWPGDRNFSLKTSKETKDGQTWTKSQMQLSCHTGTHMDAPRHLFEKGGGVDSIPLSTLIGQCRVVEVQQGIIDLQTIEQINPQRGERILFRTLNSLRQGKGEFEDMYVHFDDEAAKALVDAQVVLVGVDGPSVDGYEGPDFPAHLAFCEAGIAILENLALAEIEPGNYVLLCLPMKLKDSDGSPVRAILAR